MKLLICTLLLAATCFSLGCSSYYPTNEIPPKNTHVAKEDPNLPPEDLRSVVRQDGWYYSGGYYYPSRDYYDRYYDYYHRD